MGQLDQYFPDNQIISLESVTRFKPDPQCFELAFQSLGIAEHDQPFVLAFEGDPRGVQSVKDAGLYVCGIDTRFQKTLEVLQEAGADFVANSYAEFALVMGMPLIK